MKNCPWCHREVPETAEFCPHSGCGRSLRTGQQPGMAMPPLAPPPPPAMPQSPVVSQVAVPPGNPYAGDIASPPPPAKPQSPVVSQVAVPPGNPYAGDIASPPPPAKPQSPVVSQVAVPPGNPYAGDIASPPPPAMPQNPVASQVAVPPGNPYAGNIASPPPPVKPQSPVVSQVAVPPGNPYAENIASPPPPAKPQSPVVSQVAAPPGNPYAGDIASPPPPAMPAQPAPPSQPMASPANPYSSNIAAPPPPASNPYSGNESTPTPPPATQPPAESTGKRVEPPVKSELNKRYEPPVQSQLGRRVEPPVNSSLNRRSEPPVQSQLGRRVEPPVNSNLNRHSEPPVQSQLGRRMEPPVNSDLNKRYEPPVNCNPQRRIEPPVNSVPSMAGMFPMFQPAQMQNHYLSQTSADAFLPELRGNESQEELALREQLSRLFTTTQRKMRGGRRLLNAIWMVLMLALVIFGWFYYVTVWSYAVLSPDFAIQADPLDHERIMLGYLPQSVGKVGIGRKDGSRETVIQDRIHDGMVDEHQEFQWRIRGVKPGDKIDVWCRDGFKLVKREVSVPKGDARTVVATTGSDNENNVNNELRGVIVNALDGKPVPNVEVRVRGTELSTLSKEDGTFLLGQVPNGSQTFAISASGFTKEEYQADLSAGDPNDLRITLSPGLKEGEIRLVLTWDRKPADLDAHLEGPLPDGERFHISFQDKGDLKSKQYVQLDHDTRDGFGPETITVLGVCPGTYKYFIHDYSNRDNPDSTELAQCNAMVKVYYGGQASTFRPDVKKVGNLWNVCEITISDDLKPKVAKLGNFESQQIEALGLYEKRTREDRLDWIGEYGGTAESEAAVKRALEWLARHQCQVKGKGKKDSFGSWGRYCLDRDDKRCRCNLGEETTNGACVDTPVFEGKDYVMATTGLAVLAFQAGGNYYNNEQRFSENVRDGLEWIVRHQSANGLLITPGLKPYPGSKYHEKFMYEHAIATFALAEACAVAKATESELDPRYETAMRKAVDFIVKCQHLDGGWRYRELREEESDTSVTGWVVLALKSAKEAGYNLNYKTINGIRSFFASHTKGNETRYNKVMAGTEALTGIGMLVRQFLLNTDDFDSPYVHSAAKRLSAFAEASWQTDIESRQDPDFYTWYKCSLAMQQYGGRDWERWNQPVRDELLRLQEREGCASGSWSPFKDMWGEYGGRIYTTALGALSLQVYYRYATREDRESGIRHSNITVNGPSARTEPEVVVEPTFDENADLNEMSEDIKEKAEEHRQEMEEEAKEKDQKKAEKHRTQIDTEEADRDQLEVEIQATSESEEEKP